MNYSVIFTPEASVELQESYDWYEEMENGLGERFVQSIDKTLHIVSLNPNAFSNRKRSLREKVVKEFPFIVVYKVVKHQRVVNVLHIFHTSRNPKKKYKK